MYVYRLGGDENLVLCVNGTEKDILDTAKKFEEEIKKTPYHCSLGYFYKDSKNKDMSLDDMLKAAERKMYEDKDKFYRNSPFERRKAE